MKYLLIPLCVMFGSLGWANEEIPLKKAPIDLTDYVSMQRGARLFMNYCSACHSLQYVRYETLAKDLKITDQSGQVLDEVVKNTLMFSGDKISDTIRSALTKEEGQNWFGVVPPDLSLVNRVRGANWVYSYLLSFYPDPSRPWGVNNHVYPNVSMPDVLWDFREQLMQGENGEARWQEAVADIVNFLAYTSEPMQLQRQRLGVWVMMFLGIFLVFAILLKREYWKDVS